MIRILLDIYALVLVANAILSFFPQFRFKEWAIYIRKISDYTCKPIRKIMPHDLPFDFSPMVVILAIQFIKVLW